MLNNPVWWRKLLAWSCSDAHILVQLGVDALDNSLPLLSDAPDDADRTQQPRGVIDQIEERRDGAKTKQCPR